MHIGPAVRDIQLTIRNVDIDNSNNNNGLCLLVHECYNQNISHMSKGTV